MPDIRPWLLAPLVLALAAPAPAQTTQPTTRPAGLPEGPPVTTRPAGPPVGPPAHPVRSPRKRLGEITRGLARDFVATTESVHGATAWWKNDAVRADITVTFDGTTMIDGTMLYDQHQSRVRMELRDGTVLVFDGERAWVSPAAAEIDGARFHLLTWPYFLAVPFKLRDPGTLVRGHNVLEADGILCQTVRLHFDEGTGDSPDDRYVIAPHPTTHRLLAMGYTVTYGKPKERHNEEPHSIVYHDYEEVDGVTLSTRWSFHGWHVDIGVVGPAVGEARLSNLAFVTPPPGAFDRPDGAREDAVPRSEPAAAPE